MDNVIKQKIDKRSRKLAIKPMPIEDMSVEGINRLISIKRDIVRLIHRTNDPDSCNVRYIEDDVFDLQVELKRREEVNKLWK